MQTYSSKGFQALPDADEMRSNGCRDAIFIENESGSIHLEVTVKELEETGFEIDADVIEDDKMDALIEHLNINRILEPLH